MEGTGGGEKEEASMASSSAMKCSSTTVEVYSFIIKWASYIHAPHLKWPIRPILFLWPNPNYEHSPISAESSGTRGYPWISPQQGNFPPRPPKARMWPVTRLTRHHRWFTGGSRWFCNRASPPRAIYFRSRAWSSSRASANLKSHRSLHYLAMDSGLRWTSDYFEHQSTILFSVVNRIVTKKMNWIN